MNIVIIDDEQNILYTINKFLTQKGHTVKLFDGTEENLVEQLLNINFDILLVDLKINDTINGIDIVNSLKTQKDFLTILMTAYTTPTHLIDASKAGIKHILQKPFLPEQLFDILKDYKPKQHKENSIEMTEEMVGSFENMGKVYEKIGIAATNQLPVLILGETGTGKEVIARMIHKNSCGKEKPFLGINCANITEELFESELFGYEKGAFTGAEKQKEGLAKEVKDGTLFLDEIGEISIELQSKLLRFLEERKFRRLGGTKEIPFEGRIIAATNINMEKSIQKELFRQDLFYRLSMFTIEIPPLRKRKSDIPKLISFFISKANKELGVNVLSISDEALKKLLQLSYEGNIRELRNIVYALILNARGEIITLKDVE